MATPFTLSSALAFVGNELANYPQFRNWFQLVFLNKVSELPQAGLAAAPELVNFPATRRIVLDVTAGPRLALASYAELQGRLPKTAYLLTTMIGA